MLFQCFEKIMMFLFKFDEEYFPVVFCIEIIGK